MRFQPKYRELQNEKWLTQKYIKEKLSSTAISKLVRCHKDSVIVALKRHKIPIRDHKTARNLVPLQSFKYDILNNEEWLREKYIQEGLSTIDITELIGAKTCNSVRQALMRYRIPVRSVSDGITFGREEDGFVLNEYTQQLIEGGLLGDAMMRAYNRCSDYSYPSFVRKNKFYQHVLYVASEIGLSKGRIRECSQTLNGKKYQAFSCRTLSHKCLLPIFRKWYPPSNDYVKVVPEDLQLTPLVILHWFLDDGTASWRNRTDYEPTWKQRKTQVRLVFCSESFTENENQFLVHQLEELGLRVCLVKCHGGTGWRIKVAQSSVEDFFDLIGPCPVDSLSYRWKIPSKIA